MSIKMDNNKITNNKTKISSRAIEVDSNFDFSCDYFTLKLQLYLY